MERRAPLRAMSDKRRQQLAEQGTPRPFSTLTNGGAVGHGSTPRLAAPAPRKPTQTGPTTITVAAVFARDFGRCARCGLPVTGERGRDFSVHHRRPRAMGGTNRPDTNLPHNLVLLHGSGVSLCHGLVEQQRSEAYANGWLLRQGQDPAEVPVNHAAHGWVLLTPAGSHTTCSPNHDTTYQEAI